jgi:membrane protease YdiL (CAAX protease family)
MRDRNIFFFIRQMASVPESLSVVALLPLSSFPVYARVALIIVLFVLFQSMRLFASSEFWPDAFLQSVAAPVFFSIMIGWHPKREQLWPGFAAWIQGTLIGVVTGSLFFLFLFLITPANNAEVSISNISILRTACVVPVIEEIYFRLVLTGSLEQSALARHWTILLSGLFFALSHHYSVAPFLFPVGLAAGWLFLRYGVLSSLSMHVVYNLAILLHARNG